MKCHPTNRVLGPICIALVLLTGRCWGQAVSISCRAREVFQADRSTQVVHLRHRLVIAASDSVNLGGRHLVRDRDYRLDYAQGIVYLKVAPAPGDSLSIGYTHMPGDIKPTYCLRPVGRNSFLGEEIRTPASPWVRKPPAHDIRASGSKSVSVETGSLKEVRVNQALDLSISGTVGKDVEIRGVLSDRDAAFTGAGSTTKLRDLDRIFIEVRSANAFARVGDLEIDESPGDLLKIRRNMTGFLGNAAYGSGEFVASGAASRTRYETVELTGRESISGPYVITGSDGYAADIVKHTEKVWLDGVQMARGSEADYIMDYSRAEIYFNPKHIIREGARIVVDYESRRNDDRRQFYFARSSLALGARTSMAVSYVNEGYSPGDPDGSVGGRDSGEAVSDGGAWVDGGQFVGSGMGKYIRVELDTLRYYEFVGEGRGDYDVTFTRVGEAKGRYSYIRSDEFDSYIHVFTGMGDYTDMVKSEPRLKAQVVHLNASMKPVSWMEITSEAARSEGHCCQDGSVWTMETDRAYKVGLSASRPLPRLGGVSLGSIDVDAGRRSIGPQFIGFDRMRRPDFLELWAQEPDDGFEKSNHLDLSHSVGELLKTTLEVGSLETATGDSRRYSAGVNLGNDRLGIAASTQVARMVAGGIHRGSETNRVAVNLPVKPILLSAGRCFQLRARLRDSTSTRRTEYFSHADLSSRYGSVRLAVSTFSEERDPGGGWMAYSSVREGRLEFDTKVGKAVALRGAVSQRRIDYSPESGLGDRRATGADFHLNLRDLSLVSAMSLDYRLANTLSAVYGTRLVPVESGDYDSLGNYRPGVGGYALSRYETGMQPVTHVKAGLMVELGRKGKVILDRSVSSRTVIDIEGEDAGGRLERVAVLESGYLLNSPDAVYGLVDVRQEVVMRRNRALTLSLSARGSRLLDGRCSYRRERRKTLEFSGRLSSSGLKGVTARLEARRTATTTQWRSETGTVTPARRIWSAILSLQKRIGTAFESRVGFELTDEDRTEPRSATVEARLGPGFTFYAGPLRCDVNLGIRKILRSQTDVTPVSPRRDSVDWNSRIYGRHGRYTSFSVEYSGHRYHGLPAVHNLRASLNATF